MRHFKQTFLLLLILVTAIFSACGSSSTNTHNPGSGGSQPGNPPDQNPIPNPPTPKKILQTYVWVRENWIMSNKETKLVSLDGVLEGSTELKNNLVTVQGLAPFEAGHQPTDIPNTDSAFHDSFGQANIFYTFNELTKTYTSLNLGMTADQLLVFKDNLKPLKIFINQNGPFGIGGRYNNGTEDIRLYKFPGVSMQSPNKITLQDSSTDLDVAVHEMGHWFQDHLLFDINRGDPTTGQWMEGYAESIPLLIFRNSMMGETFTFGGFDYDFGNFGSYTGAFPVFTWALAKQIHEQLTGKALAACNLPLMERNQCELLDQDAARETLKILWTLPLFIGTQTPFYGDVEKSIVESLNSLRKAGKLDPRLDVDPLISWVGSEWPRLLPVSQNAVFQTIPVPISATNEELVRTAVHLFGLQSDDDSRPVLLAGSLFTPHGLYSHSLNGPNGEVFDRFQPYIAVDPNRNDFPGISNARGKEFPTRHYDNYMTFIRSSDGVLASVGRHISEQPRLNSCSSLTADGVIFHLCNQRLSWSEAESWCSNQGWRLASIDNATQNKAVAAEAKRIGMAFWYIGLKDLFESDPAPFRWTDQSVPSFTAWANGNPVNHMGTPDCAAITHLTDATWRTIDCNLMERFICREP